MNTPQYSSLMELDDLDDQEEQIQKAKVFQSLAPTQLTQHIVSTSSGSGGDGPNIAQPPPAPPSQSLMSYFRPSSTAASSTGATAPVVLQSPSQLDAIEAQRNAAAFTRLNNPPTTNPGNPPHSMFNLL